MTKGEKEALLALLGVVVVGGAATGIVLAVKSTNASAATPPAKGTTPSGLPQLNPGTITLLPSHSYKVIGQVPPNVVDLPSLQANFDQVLGVGLFTVTDVTIQQGQMTALVTYNGSAPITIPSGGTTYTFVDLGVIQSVPQGIMIGHLPPGPILHPAFARAHIQKNIARRAGGV